MTVTPGDLVHSNHLRIQAFWGRGKEGKHLEFIFRLLDFGRAGSDLNQTCPLWKMVPDLRDATFASRFSVLLRGTEGQDESWVWSRSSLSLLCRRLSGRNWKGGDGRRVASYEDFGQCVGSGAGDVAFGGVESDVVDRLFKLLAVCRELLDTRLALQVP